MTRLLCRSLLVAATVALWAGPAQAQTYGGILGGEKEPDQESVVKSNSFTATTVASPTSNSTKTGSSGNSGVKSGSLARTGQALITPLVQGSAVLVGSGVLLVLVARRRRQDQSDTW